MLAALTVTAPTAAAAATIPWRSAPHPLRVHALRQDIRLHRGHAAASAAGLGLLLQIRHTEMATVSLGRLNAIDAAWQARHHAYEAALQARAPVYAALMCIHRYEGAWNAYNPAGPYYGGLQMDATFEAHYGPEYVQSWGHAWNWPPAMQLAAAWRAVLAVGYTPWPATAAACGLL